jgi:hypothetical protein
LIGEVIADKHRHSTAERRLLHECLNGRGFAEAPRLDLPQHFAALNVVITAERFRNRNDGLAQHRFELRRLAKMQPDGSILVLEQRSGVRIDKSPQGGARAIELRVDKVRALNRAIRPAAGSLSGANI